ncbi:hypothetical protein PRIPAC_82198, partial [Pristionchus pacificus]|uniref:Uncharacterized protein n=1 Tax=Pristionchus pacificus TaxID=54126 RepID=A0A2A6CBH8_PRIPA
GVPDSERAEMDELVKKEQMAQEKRRKSREEKMKMGVKCSPCHGESNDRPIIRLAVTRANTSPKESAFLDMSVTVTNTGKVQTSLYNKTDDYSFSVVRYPHYESNIPISMGLNTLHGEIIRIFRNCSLFEHFLERTRQVAHYFLQIQYPKEIVYSRLYSTLNRTPAISLKYAVCNNDICMLVRYPHYESNIPISMGLNTLHGEIIRIFRNCSLFEFFLSLPFPSLSSLLPSRNYSDRRLV